VALYCVAFPVTTDSGLKGFSENTLDTLAKAMNKDDIQNAQKRAKTWLEAHPMKVQQ
jgi:hypothetical protein